MEEVTEALVHVQGTTLNWDVLADIMKSAALQVVGVCPRRNAKPWLRGKEREVVDLEQTVHQAVLTVRMARAQGIQNIGHLIQARKDASSALRSSKRRWEANWWDDLAMKANQAGETGDDKLFWQVCKQPREPKSL